MHVPLRVAGVTFQEYQKHSIIKNVKGTDKRATSWGGRAWPDIPASHRASGLLVTKRETRNNSPSGPPERTNSGDTLTPNFWPPKLRINFHFFNSQFFFLKVYKELKGLVCDLLVGGPNVESHKTEF